MNQMINPDKKDKDCRIAIINPNMIIEKEFIDTPYFINMGMMQLASYLKERFSNVDVYDTFSQDDSKVWSIGRQVKFGTGKSL